jgi:hypothetical protein
MVSEWSKKKKASAQRIGSKREANTHSKKKKKFNMSIEQEKKKPTSHPVLSCISTP